jgi:plastocyanin
MRAIICLLTQKSRMTGVLSCAVLLVVSVGLLSPTLSFAAKKLSASSSQTYTVMVGLEKPNKGIGVMAYFPSSVTIHTGDTVHWVQNSNEIHTVTFLDGVPLPDLLLPADVAGADSGISPLVFNPAVASPAIPAGGLYTGGIGAYANSGIMGREPGQVGEFDLTFPNEGTFGYVCVVHGFAMSGEVVVVGEDHKIASPNQAMAEGRKQMAEALSMVPAVVRDAAGQVVPPETNGDGTMSHTVMVGYSGTVAASYGDVEIDLMQFFPNKLTVRPGDTLKFEMSANNIAPHTATFLNGAEEPALAVFQNGFLYLNSEVVFPSGAAVLTRTGIFNSGLMLPIPGTTFSLTIGEMKSGLEHFICLLHDSSGMEGELMVLPGTPDLD